MQNNETYLFTQLHTEIHNMLMEWKKYDMPLSKEMYVTEYNYEYNVSTYKPKGIEEFRDDLQPVIRSDLEVPWRVGVTSGWVIARG